MEKIRNDTGPEIVPATKIVLMIIVAGIVVILMPIVIAGEEGDREWKLVGSITERAGKDIADRESKNWNPDAKLIKIRIWKTEIWKSADGSLKRYTTGWQYFYRSNDNRYLQISIDFDAYKNDTAKTEELSIEEVKVLGLEKLKPLSEWDWNIVSANVIRIASNRYGMSLERGDFIGYLNLSMRDVKHVSIPVWHLSIVNGITSVETNYMMDANTGRIIYVGEGRIDEREVEISGIPEKAGNDIAGREAKNWNPDAELIKICAWKGELREYYGRSVLYTTGWEYFYRSGINNYLHALIDIDDYMNGTAKIIELSEEEAVVLGSENLKPLNEWDIVSWNAIKIASDVQGICFERGDYIGSYYLCMRDIKGIAIPVWHISLGDGLAGIWTDYTINANTGEIIFGGRSDVIIEFIDFESRVIKGQINVFEVEITNYGDYDVYGVIVEFKEGTKILGNVTIPVLLAGEIETVSYLWDTKDVPLEVHEIVIVVRPELFDEKGPKVKLFDSTKVKVKVLPPSETSTFIVTNLKRMAEKWKNDNISEFEEKLIELSFHPNVNGIIVNVEDETNCSNLYDEWYIDKEPEKANEIAKAIKDLIDSKGKEYPNIEYMIIVGDDRIIPFYRITDNTDKPFGPESWRTEDEYRKLNRNSTVGSALNKKMFLTDNIYATVKSIEWKTAEVSIPELFVPVIPIGRLVESPGEISATIDAFYQKDYISPDKVFVTGDHFMKDSALYCGSLLKEEMENEPEIIVNLTPDYTKNIVAELLNTSNNIVLVFQHADHNQFYIYGDREINITSQNISHSVADLNSSIVYSLGCHSGLNVPTNASVNDFDLVQAYVQKGVLAYIAPTGYSIGSHWTRAAHELIISYFTRYLCDGLDAGTALTLAKQEYWATNYDFNYFDEQVLETTTLYGLPMARINMPHPTTSGNESEMRIMSLERKTTENPDTIVIRPTHTLKSAHAGQYYITTSEEHLSDPRKPVQPKEIRIFHPTSTKMLHGAVMTSGKYKIIKSFVPLIEWYERSPEQKPEPVPIEQENWYPAPVFKINTICYPNAPMRTLQYMIIVTGQYKGGTMGTERLYEELSFDLYYASPKEETIPPIIEPIKDPIKINDTINISVNASDNESRIQRVLVTYTDGEGEWKSKELNKTSEQWTCEIPIDEIFEFFVQAVDNAGNVAVGEQRGI